MYLIVEELCLDTSYTVPHTCLQLLCLADGWNKSQVRHSRVEEDEGKWIKQVANPAQV